MSTLNELEYDYLKEGGNAFTGFNELTVTESTTLIDLKSVYGESFLRDRTVTTGSGTVTNSDGLFAVSTGTTPGSTAVLESSEKGRYVAGLEAIPGAGGFLNRAPTGDETVRWGYFRTNEGFGFGQDSTGTFVFKRRKGVETKVYREKWFTPLDFDTTNFHIYRLPFRWYGQGPVRYEVSTQDGENSPTLTCVHALAAEDGENITADPNLRLRVEVDNGTGSGDLVFFVGGRQFAVQGRYNPSFRLTSETVTAKSVSDGVFSPVITFRQKNTFPEVSAKLQSVSLYATTNDVHWKVLVGGTVSTGTSFGSVSDLPDAETAFEVDTASTNITGGQKLTEDFVVAGSGRTSNGGRLEVPDIDLPDDVEIALVAAGVDGPSTINAVFTVREEW